MLAVTQSRAVSGGTPGKIPMNPFTCNSVRIAQPQQEDRHTALLPPAMAHLNLLHFLRELYLLAFIYFRLTAQRNSWLGINVIHEEQKGGLGMRYVAF